MSLKAREAASSSSTVLGRLEEFPDASEDMEMNETNEFKNPDSTLTEGVDADFSRRSFTLKKYASF
jgi:hypothetical protein